MEPRSRLQIATAILLLGQDVPTMHHEPDKGDGVGKRVVGRSDVSPNTKPKRNEPCHCGSGKKFKKCCGGVR